MIQVFRDTELLSVSADQQFNTVLFFLGIFHCYLVCELVGFGFLQLCRTEFIPLEEGAQLVVQNRVDPRRRVMILWEI